MSARMRKALYGDDGHFDAVDKKLLSFLAKNLPGLDGKPRPVPSTLGYSRGMSVAEAARQTHLRSDSRPVLLRCCSHVDKVKKNGLQDLWTFDSANVAGDWQDDHCTRVCSFW